MSSTDANGARHSGRFFGRMVRGRRSGFLLLVALLALWETSARGGWVVSENWPPVTQVIASAAVGLAGGEISWALAATIYHAAAGFVIGATAGVLIGMLMAVFAPIRRTIEPALELLRPIPVPAIIPPLILFLGLDDPMKITVVSLTVFFPVMVNTVEGGTSVEPTYGAVAATFGLPALRALRTVLLPATLPYVFAGLRVSVALALIVAVVSEMIAGTSGIGYFVVSMEYAGRAADMYAALIVLALTGYLANLAFGMIERRALHWHFASDGGARAE